MPAINADANTVINYLKKQGIEKLDYLIGTHPHEDHIGGIDKVIDTFDIKKVIMPKAQNNTKTFEDVLNAISNKGLKITTPIPGTNYSLGNASFTIFAPNNPPYSDLNNYSVVIKLEFGKTSFLFTGDAGNASETEMLNKEFNLKADLLKVGHHGSRYSTSNAFLNKVSPEYAIISVGKDNTYGHPTPETISRLSSKNIQVYRTDKNGTIIANSDGNTIKIEVKSSPEKAQAPPEIIDEGSSQTDNASNGIGYIGNKNTKKVS